MLMLHLRLPYLHHKCLLIRQCNDKHQQRTNRLQLLHPRRTDMHLLLAPHQHLANPASVDLHQELHDQLRLILMQLLHHLLVPILPLLHHHKLSRLLKLHHHQELRLRKLHHHHKDLRGDLPLQDHHCHVQARHRVKARPLRPLRSIVSLSVKVLQHYANIHVAAGDRSHIPPEAQPIYDVLNAEMQRVKAVAPATYKNHVDDAEKRLNILFDQLNNGVIGGQALSQFQALAEAFRSRNFDQAQAIHGALAQFPEVSSPALVSLGIIEDFGIAC